MEMSNRARALAERLEITEERLRRAFILEVMALPKTELQDLAKVHPQKPERLSTAQVDIVVACLESAAERLSRK